MRIKVSYINPFEQGGHLLVNYSGVSIYDDATLLKTGVIHCAAAMVDGKGEYLHIVADRAEPVLSHSIDDIAPILVPEPTPRIQFQEPAPNQSLDVRGIEVDGCGPGAAVDSKVVKARGGWPQHMK